jgi:polyribonucleotide nucleotidyltransferase
VNIRPGRDGLLHISKLGGGKRVERVESVLTLGQEVEVKVDDIDPQGKVSLSLASELPVTDAGSGDDSPAGVSESGSSSGGSGGRRSGSDAGTGRSANASRDAGERRDVGDGGNARGVEVVSFEADFEEELTRDLGDLGPAPLRGREGGDRSDRDGPRRPARRARR